MVFLRDSFDGKNYHEPLTRPQIIYACLMVVPVFFLLLSPYFEVYGSFVHGGAVAAFSIFLLAYKVWQKIFANYYLFFLMAALVFPVVVFHVIGGLTFAVVPDFIFLRLLFTFTFYFALGLAVGYLLKVHNFKVGQAVTVSVAWVFFVGLINSAIVFLGFLHPDVKALFESLLWYDNGMNINYRSSEYRLRGFASAGGASLSVFHSISFVAATWLYLRTRVGLWWFLSASLLIITSILFVGRTGLFLAVLGSGLLVVSYLFRNLMRKRMDGRIIGIILFSITALILISFSEGLLSKNIYNYTVGLLVGGSSALQDEGTVSVIFSFYHMPEGLIHLIFGNGVFSGGFDGVNATDAGYMKMFTAAGLFGSAWFYGVFLLFVGLILKRASNVFRKYSFVYIVLVLLFVAEVKEPFIIQGYSSRALMLVLGVLAAYAANLTVRQRSTSTGLQTDRGNGL